MRSPGNFTLWAGNVKLPELPKISVFFFFKNLYICAMSSQNPAQSSTKLLFFRKTLFPLAFLANLLFNAKLGCFFHQKSSLSGKSRTNPHSVGQIPGVVTFPHDFSHPCPAQPWNPLSPPCTANKGKQKIKSIIIITNST